MNIPLTYNLRNLVIRKTTTLMTVAGIALTVAVLVSSLALVNGLLLRPSRNTGNPLQILVLRQGGNSELGSSVSRESYELLRTMSGIARDASNEPMASLEMVQVINLPSVDDPRGMNVTLRGLLPMGIAMRTVHLVSGLGFNPGIGRSSSASPLHSAIRMHSWAGISALARAIGRLSGSWMASNRRSTAKSGVT